MKTEIEYLCEINDLIKQITGRDTVISLESTLTNDLLLSSLEIVQLIVLIEEKYNILIDMDVLFTTISDIVELINKECGQHV